MIVIFIFEMTQIICIESYWGFIQYNDIILDKYFMFQRERKHIIWEKYFPLLHYFIARKDLQGKKFIKTFFLCYIREVTRRIFNLLFQSYL